MTQSSTRARARRLHRQATQNLATPTASADKPASVLDPDSSVTTTVTEEQGTLAALLTIDTIAKGSLPPHFFSRYQAYRQGLLASGQDIQSVAIALSLFVWDLFKRRPNSTLH